MEIKCKVLLVYTGKRMKGSLLLNKTTRRLHLFDESLSDDYESVILFITTNDTRTYSRLKFLDIRNCPSKFINFESEAPLDQVSAMSVRNNYIIPRIPENFLIQFINEWNSNNVITQVGVEFENYESRNSSLNPKVGPIIVSSCMEDPYQINITDFRESKYNDGSIDLILNPRDTLFYYESNQS